MIPSVLGKIGSLLILACGTSYYAGLTAKYWLPSVARNLGERGVALGVCESPWRNPASGTAGSPPLGRAGRDSLPSFRRSFGFPDRSPNRNGTLPPTEPERTFEDEPNDRYPARTNRDPGRKPAGTVGGSNVVVFRPYNFDRTGTEPKTKPDVRLGNVRSVRSGDVDEYRE